MPGRRHPAISDEHAQQVYEQNSFMGGLGGQSLIPQPTGRQAKMPQADQQRLYFLFDDYWANGSQTKFPLRYQPVFESIRVYVQDAYVRYRAGWQLAPEPGFARPIIEILVPIPAYTKVTIQYATTTPETLYDCGNIDPIQLPPEGIDFSNFPQPYFDLVLAQRGMYMWESLRPVGKNFPYLPYDAWQEYEPKKTLAYGFTPADGYDPYMGWVHMDQAVLWVWNVGSEEYDAPVEQIAKLVDSDAPWSATGIRFQEVPWNDGSVGDSGYHLDVRGGTRVFDWSRGTYATHETYLRMPPTSGGGAASGLYFWGQFTFNRLFFSTNPSEGITPNDEIVYFNFLPNEDYDGDKTWYLDAGSDYAYAEREAIRFSVDPYDNQYHRYRIHFDFATNETTFSIDDESCTFKSEFWMSDPETIRLWPHYTGDDDYVMATDGSKQYFAGSQFPTGLWSHPGYEDIVELEIVGYADYMDCGGHRFMTDAPLVQSGSIVQVSNIPFDGQGLF